MARRLKIHSVTAVALCAQGANFDEATHDGAHVTLFKARNAPAPPSRPCTANAVSVTTFAKAVDAHPGVPITEALYRYFRANPGAYEHYRQSVNHGNKSTAGE